MLHDSLFLLMPWFKPAINGDLCMLHLLQHYLGDFPSERFSEAKAQDCIARFRKALGDLDADIVERNKPLDVPYVYLRPSRVTNSITI